MTNLEVGSTLSDRAPTPVSPRVGGAKPLLRAQETTPTIIRILLPSPTITNLPSTSLPSIYPPRPPPKMNGEDPPERPDYVTSIINGLERYNPEAVVTLENYLQEQCEQKYCDCNANRTLLKL